MRFSKIDLAATNPSRVQSSYDDQVVVEQVFNVPVIAGIIARKWQDTPF